MKQYENYNDDDLARLFTNANDIVSNNKPKKEKAIAVIEWIKSEWSRRKIYI